MTAPVAGGADAAAPGGVTSAVVVGAGLAGLTAASGLAERGVEVTVLEARERVGGRTHGLRVSPTGWVDAGAAYLATATPNCWP